MAPTPVFSCEICKMFKNIYFEEHLRTTASKKIVIEGISYLVKQLSSCPCTPQSCMVDRSGCSCGKKAMRYQILSLKSKDL